MNEYELVLVIHPRLNADETMAAIANIQSQIEANGGEMLSTDVWGRRRLAYPINHLLEGTYVLMTFKLPPQSAPIVEALLRISEQVIRHLLVRGIIPFQGHDRRDRDDRDRDGRDDRGRDERDDRDRDRHRDPVASAASDAEPEMVEAEVALAAE
ncbi:MAG: 30S ribosomal protein S6 [Dehalococcoidia bacterium]|nr:30S ribosomal protein S6 [Dehalococcoidia bacterium]